MTVFSVGLLGHGTVGFYAKTPVRAGLDGNRLVVAYNVGDWGEIRELLKLSKMDISVWIVTFALTVFADLTLAVELGMILAMLLFIRKVSQTTTVSLVTKEYVVPVVPMLPSASALRSAS